MQFLISADRKERLAEEPLNYEREVKGSFDNYFAKRIGDAIVAHSLHLCPVTTPISSFTSRFKASRLTSFGFE